jgi:hypothetical protein
MTVKNTGYTAGITKPLFTMTWNKDHQIYCQGLKTTVTKIKGGSKIPGAE